MEAERSQIRVEPPVSYDSEMIGTSHFLVIGAMKAGTSSLFSWLAEQPEVAVPPDIKEPNFFSDEGQWARGWSWYTDLFGPAEGRLTGEASVAYTNPAVAAISAKRIAERIPEVRLIYLVRHPLQRVASEYRHQVQRGREDRSFSHATSDATTPYADRSRYFTCLSPYIEGFPREQLLVIRSEDLDHGGWSSVLRHLGLSERPTTSGARNVTDSKRGYSQLMRWLYDRGLTRPLERLPAPVRRLGGKLAFRTDPAYRQLLDSAGAELSPATAESIWSDVARLESWLGTGPLWQR
jgi:hypothetical protein